MLQKKDDFTEHLQDKQGPELMDGCGQGSRVIMCTLRESQDLLNFNLRAHANSILDPGQGEVAPVETAGSSHIHFSKARTSLFLKKE